MDKRALSAAFRTRFRSLLDDVRDDLPGFLDAAQIDRSALSQLRDPKQDRLPRAETLRRIAQATGVSVDWLLCLENAREGRQQITHSSELLGSDLSGRELLADDQSSDQSPLARWRAEAAGHKLRYVPAKLPDMLSLSAEVDGARSEEEVLTGFDLDAMDLEIAMPLQTLEALALSQGDWRATAGTAASQQIEHMALICEAHYPSLRLHLYDGATEFSAPFTVFGRMRAAVYVGGAYISVTGASDVNYFTKRFDNLVRQSVIPPDRVHQTLRNLID